MPELLSLSLALAPFLLPWARDLGVLLPARTGFAEGKSGFNLHGIIYWGCEQEKWSLVGQIQFFMPSQQKLLIFREVSWHLGESPLVELGPFQGASWLGLCAQHGQ